MEGSVEEVCVVEGSVAEAEVSVVEVSLDGTISRLSEVAFAVEVTVEGAV